MDIAPRIRHLLVLLLSVTPLLASSYNFWNSAANGIQLPNHFVIDGEYQSVIVTAKNSIYQLSLDLQDQQFVNITPAPSTYDDCVANLRTTDECQNYPHILLLPTGDSTITDGMGATHNVNETILVCGSNAFAPICRYRKRENLSEIMTVSGNKFCPYDPSTVSSAMWSNDRLLSGTQLDDQPVKYGITLSNSPFTGEVAVATLSVTGNVVWFYKTPQFISSYEVGDYLYLFFREEAIEISDYRNDMGASSISSQQQNIFTTFIKARMSCTSGSTTSGDIPYHFNELRDTFFMESGSYDNNGNSEQHLYAVFTGPENGPVGSAVCVYTFGSHDDDLDNVFTNDYMERIGVGQWDTLTNYDPFTCATGRSVQDAERYQLVESSATQSSGNHPLMQPSGFFLQRIVVDTVIGLDGVSYEVMFIAGLKDDKVVLLKATYISERNGDQHYISQSITLEPESDSGMVSDTDVVLESETTPDITEMKLFGTGYSAFVYVGTSIGLYRVSSTRCEQYTDCCECIAARDPYCAYDTNSGSCVAIDDGNRDSGSLIQDVVNGDIETCSGMASSMPPIPSPSVTTGTGSSSGTSQPGTFEPGTSTDSSSTNSLPCTDHPTPTAANPPVVNEGQTSFINPFPTETTYSTPNIDGVTAKSSDDPNHTWTIVGSVSGFIGGVVLGIIVMAIYFNRRNFLWNKYCPNSAEVGQKEPVQCKSYSRRQSAAANFYSKEEEFTKNNSEFMVPPMDSSPGSTRFLPSNQNPFTNLTDYPKRPPLPHVGVINPAYNPKSAPVSPYTSPFGSPYRTAAVPPRPNPNIKSTIHVEERISNREREAYGRNIIARTPSVDASRKPSNFTSRPNGHVQRLPVSYDARGDFVQIHDSELGCSSC